MFFRKTPKRRGITGSNNRVLKYLVIVFFIFSILFGVGGGVYILFQIRNVDFILNSVDCTNEDGVLRSLNIRGRNIFVVDEKRLVEKLKKDFPCIKEAEVTKILPDKLKIQATGRLAVLALYRLDERAVISLKDLEATSSSFTASIRDFYTDGRAGERLLIDSEGLVIAKTDEVGDLIQVGVGRGDWEKGLEEDLVKSILKAREGFLKIEFKVESIKLIFEDILIVEGEYQDYGKLAAVFKIRKAHEYPDRLAIEVQMATLHLILQKAKMNLGEAEERQKGTQRIESVDLRFDKPVIKYRR